MSRQGHFPLSDIVRVDPDEFRAALPEWPGYIRKNMETAGSLTQREAGMIQEIATEAALKLHKNVWVDGSLRDGEWFSGVFDRIRRDHPAYSIAILHVYADWEVVAQRAAERAKKTGRVIPRESLEESLRRCPRSVELLTPKADFVAHIENNGRGPELKLVCQKEQGELKDVTWKDVRVRFRTHRVFQIADRQSTGNRCREFLLEVQGRAEVIVFTKSYCSWCHKLFQELKELLGQGFQRCKCFCLDKLPLDADVALQAELMSMNGIGTVPQLYVHGKFIGDYTGFKSLVDKGEARKLFKSGSL